MAPQHCAEASPMPSLQRPLKRRRLGRFVYTGLPKPVPDNYAARDAVSPAVVSTPDPIAGSPLRNAAPSRTCPHLPRLALLLQCKLNPHPRSTSSRMLLPAASPCPMPLLPVMGTSSSRFLLPCQRDVSHRLIPSPRGPLMHHLRHLIFLSRVT